MQYEYCEKYSEANRGTTKVQATGRRVDTVRDEDGSSQERGWGQKVLC